MSWMIQLGVFGETMKAAADPKAFGFVFLGYLIFTLYMTIGSIETNKTLLIIFILIDFLFIGLALSSFGIFLMVFQVVKILFQKFYSIHLKQNHKMT